MDALSDPKAHLSAQEKRDKQMQAMGIEASDINTKDLKGSKSTMAGLNKPNSSLSKVMGNVQQAKREEERSGKNNSYQFL